MTAILFPVLQFFDNDGEPLNGGKIYTYAAGTLTPKATYTTAAASVEQPNPIILDSSGRVETTKVFYIDGSYDFVIKTSADVTIETIEDITTGQDLSTLYTPASASNATMLNLFEDTDNGSHKVVVQAPASLAADYNFVFPVNDGDAGQKLKTDGSGNTSWVSTGSTRQYLTSGSSATYTTPSGCIAILVKAWGGGGGGSATATNSGAAGTATIFNSVQAAGGGGGTVPAAGKGQTGGIGGSGGTGSATFRMRGASGQGSGNPTSGAPGGLGASTSLGGNGYGVVDAAGTNAVANSGSGGGGGCSNSNGIGTGGGAGEYFELYISSPVATYTYTIGGGGNGGAAGTNAGGNGGSGLIIVEEFY